MREFDDATLAAAILATFKRRETPLPQGAPPALTDAFSEDTAKQRLWQAFLRNGGLEAEGKSLPEVVAEIRDFLMPLVGALNAGREFRGAWQDGRRQEQS